MARYVERAENTARMLDANLQSSLLPQAGSTPGEVWHTMLSLSELKTPTWPAMTRSALTACWIYGQRHQ